MKLHRHFFTALFLCLLAPATLRAAEPLHVAITANGTKINGDGLDGAIIALGFDHEVVTPHNPASGLPTGRRIYKPIRIVKPIDKTTPLLYKALVNNEGISAVFRLRRPAEPGQIGGSPTPYTYYTVSITGGRITGIRDWKTNTRDLSADRAGDLEEVSFTFHTITWTWVDGGITHSDTWNSSP